jgi:cell division cycle 20-like protein 1 (cofactor of APC complex)
MCLCTVHTHAQSGGNDNKLLVWSTRSQLPLLKLAEHTAAVKAIAWSPHVHGLLASGACSMRAFMRMRTQMHAHTRTQATAANTRCSILCAVSRP